MIRSARVLLRCAEVSQTMHLVAGTRLGPYEILAPIGAGGMGEVYRARDPRLSRDVAIKVLPRHLSGDPYALGRFEIEARAVAALSHPNILAIFDVGNDNGTAYVVAELLEGETLRSRLSRDQAVPWRKAVEIATAIADGLSAAHSKGIVHRDLKPANIFVTLDGRVKILDFGLARWTPAESSTDQRDVPTQTVPGAVMGTVGYMSPEQVRGESADAPSDIFSFGCVLYEMLCGRRAFERETGVQTMTAILESHPSPLLESGVQVPRDLDRIVARCLEKNPGERFQSARDLGFALRSVLSVPETSMLETARPASRLRAALPLIAAAVFLLSAVATYWMGPSEGPIDSIAILPFANDSGSPDMDYLGDGITESLINSLSRVPNLAVMSRNAVFRYKGRANDAQAAGQALKVRAVLTGRVEQRGDALSISAELMDVGSSRALWGEKYDRRVGDILTLQDEISTEISGKLRYRLTGEQMARLTRRYTDNTEAYQLYLRGRYYWNKKTPDGFNKGIEYFQQAIDADPNYAPAYAGLASVYLNLANYNFALVPPREAWVKAKTAAKRALEIDEGLAAAHAALALIAYQWEWDWPTAESEFKRAIELDPGSSSTYEPSPSSTFHWYSHYLMTVGRVDESFRTGRRAVDLDAVDLANNAHQGWYFLWTREYGRAIDPLKKAIEMDGSFVISQWYLGLAYEQQGAYPDAIAVFQNCVKLTGERASMLALLGHAHAAAGHRNEARAILRQLAEKAKQGYVPAYPVAAIHAALGEKDEAFRWLEKAYESRDSWMDYLVLDPRLDNLRTDPRFSDLLHRMKLAS